MPHPYFVAGACPALSAIACVALATQDDTDPLSSLKLNLIAVDILDRARESARSQR